MTNDLRKFLNILNESGSISTNQQVSDLAENAFHAAIKHIQDALGISTGDYAGIHFSDDEQKQQIINILENYIVNELKFKQQS